MKRKILILIITIVAMAATQNAYCQTNLYNQYKHLTDVRVVCIMDFPVDENVKVDITMLEPKTKEAVYYLVEEFNLGIEKDIIDKTFGDKNNMGLFSRNVYKNDPTKKYGAIGGNDDYKNISVLAYNCNTGAIIIFHNIETKERDYKIEQFLVRTLKRPDLLPKTRNKDDYNNK